MSIFGDAWDWTKGAASDAWDWTKGAASDVGSTAWSGMEDTFSQDTVTPGYPEYQYGKIGGSDTASEDYYDKLDAWGTNDSWGINNATKTGQAALGSAASNAYSAATNKDASGTAAQQGAINQYNSVLSGQTKTLAEQQLAAQSDQNVANAMALARSGRGVGASAAAQQQAQQQASAEGQKLNLQQAQLRAQEVSDATTGLANAGSNLTQSAIAQQNQGLAATNASAQLGLSGAEQKAQSNYRYQALANQAKIAEAQNETSLDTARVQSDTAASTANAANDASRDSSVVGMVGGAAGAAGALFSDRRVKRDIHDDDDAVSAALDQLSAKRYRYTGEPAGTRHEGIIAQDLARTPAGRSTLGKTHDGTLYIDGIKGLSFALGGLANLNERLRRLEGE